MRRKIRKFKGGGADMGDPGRAQERADRGYGDTSGVDRSAVGAGSKFAKNRAKQNLEIQRKKAIETISPSTTFSGQALRYGLAFAGVPFPKTITEKMLNTGASMGYGKTKTKTTTSPKNLGGDGQDNAIIKKKVIQPIQATKPIDQSLINPKDNFFNFKSYNVGGLSGGVSYGPPPKRGPNSQVPPIKMKKGGHKK